MTFDPSKLSPAPWENQHGFVADGSGRQNIGCTIQADADFVALARNAEDVQMRRGWYAVPYRRSNDAGTVLDWIVVNTFAVPVERGGNTGIYFIGHPFTALVAADEWLKAQEAK